MAQSVAARTKTIRRAEQRFGRTVREDHVRVAVDDQHAMHKRIERIERIAGTGLAGGGFRGALLHADRVAPMCCPMCAQTSGQRRASTPASWIESIRLERSVAAGMQGSVPERPHDWGKGERGNKRTLLQRGFICT